MIFNSSWCHRLPNTLAGCSLMLGSWQPLWKPLFTNSSDVLSTILSVLNAYIEPCKSSIANLSLTFHFMLMAVLTALIILWRQDLNMDTSVLAALFAIFMPVPHVLMFLWVCYKIQKRFHLRQRTVTWINLILVQVNFKLVQYIPELPYISFAQLPRVS